jgi:hypothetical protein
MNPLLSKEPGLKDIEGKARLTLLSAILNNAVLEVEGLLYLRVLLKAKGPTASMPINEQIGTIIMSPEKISTSRPNPMMRPKLLPNHVPQKDPVSSPIFPIKKTPAAFPKDIIETKPITKAQSNASLLQFLPSG